MKVKLSALTSVLPERIDLFLCAASFEGRSQSVPCALRPDAVGKVLVSTSASIARYSRANEKAITDHFGAGATRFIHSGAGPLSFADSLQNSLEQFDAEVICTILVDVTTFTREYLLVALKMLRGWARRDARVYIAYNGAKSYETGKRKWLSADYREVRSVLGYPGEFSPTRNLHLIVLFGFEVERAARAIRAFEPSVLSIGHGDEAHSITHEHYQRNMELFERLATIRPAVNRFTLTLDDPSAASEEISLLADAFPAYNTVVVPMNTKLSTVGAALSVWREPRIQLAYVAANRYNVSGYSRPGEDAHLFELPAVDAVLERQEKST